MEKIIGAKIEGSTLPTLPVCAGAGDGAKLSEKRVLLTALALHHNHHYHHYHQHAGPHHWSLVHSHFDSLVPRIGYWAMNRNLRYDFRSFQTIVKSISVLRILVLATLRDLKFVQESEQEDSIHLVELRPSLRVLQIKCVRVQLCGSQKRDWQIV